MKRIHEFSLYALFACVGMAIPLACLTIQGCVPQQRSDNHLTSQWQRVGHDSGVEVSRVHAKIFRDAADQEWDDPRALSDYLLEQTRERLPATYQKIGINMAVEFDDGWDKDRATVILNELAKGFDAVR